MRKTFIKILVLLVPALAAAGTAGAQGGIDRRIEVTRQYIPEVGAAEKLDFMPAQVDTVALRPEIDYSVTPTPWKGVFDAEPINPIKIDAEPYRPQRPFFLRLAAGLPLQSLADLYATASPRGDIAFGTYLNHYGRWADIRNDLGNRENATATYNVVGAFFEKRFARKVLSVNISDTYRYLRAFGGFVPFTASAAPVRLTSGSGIGYNDLTGRVVFGDSFLDLSRFNYRVGVEVSTFADREKTGQNELDIFFDSGWRLYGGDFTAGLGFCIEGGTAALSDHGDWRLSFAPGYDFEVKDLSVGVGLEFLHNKETGFHIFPAIDLTYGALDGFIPYLHIDGALEGGCYRMMSYANPYIVSGLELPHPSHYDFKIGAHGSLVRAVSYDLFFSAALWNDYNYFVNDFRETADGFDTSWFSGMTDDNVTIFTVGGALGATIARGLTFDLGLKVNMVSSAAASQRLWHDGEDAYSVDNFATGLGIPQFELSAALRYNFRERLFLSAAVEVMGKREFSAVRLDPHVASQPVIRVANNEVPVSVNLKFDAEYRISSRLNAFVRCDNLLDKRLYRYNYYPELGANVMLGVKVAF